MSKPSRIRQILLAAALTAACLAGAVDLNVWPLRASTAAAQDATADYIPPPCSNTECQGIQGCRYWPGTYCSFPDAFTCVNRACRS